MNIIVSTPRLVLRQFTGLDASLVYRLNSIPEVINYLHEPILENEAQALEVIQTILVPQYKNKLGRWAIHLKENNEFIGWCGLKFIADTGEIDLGFRLLPHSWGMGYASEAAIHTLDYGFNKLQLKEVIGKAHIENLASIKVLAKAGMHFVKECVEDGLPVKVFRAINPGQ